jgi:hypothetical protein
VNPDDISQAVVESQINANGKELMLAGLYAKFCCFCVAVNF